MHLDSFQPNSLQYILAVYSGNVHYHRYDSKNDRIETAAPLTLENAKTITKAIRSEELCLSNINFEGMIPKNVLHFKTDFKEIIFYTAPTKRQLVFSDNLPITTAQYPTPYLLWHINGNRLNIYALDSQPKDLEAELYQAPFLNVGSNGNVCLGTANLGKFDTYEETMEDALHKFFNSTFTHTNTDALATRSITDIYNEQLDQNIQHFDNQLLLRKGQTISQLIK